MSRENKTNNNSILHRIKKQPLMLIIFVSVLLRVAAAISMGNEVQELAGIYDQVSYHTLATRVLGGHGFTFGVGWWPITRAGEPTAHWSFLYTLYLVATYALFGIQPVVARILQAVIVGILHPYITYRIGEKIFGKQVGFIAAVITSLYVYYIYYGAALMTESFYITAILVSLFLSMQLAESHDKKQDIKLGIALGISIGLTVILRQVFLLFIPFLFLWIWIARFRLHRNLPIISTILTFTLIILFILPITLYNYSRFQRFVLLNTNSGYAFFWGNNPIYGTRFIPIMSPKNYRDLIPEEIRYLDEAALDSELLSRGLQFVVQDPKRIFLLSISRIPLYFMFWYSPRSSMLSNISRIGSFGIMLPFMLYGLFLGIRRSRNILELLTSSRGLLILFGLVYSGIHILTWTLIRYRLPVDAVLIPFAGLALFDIGQRVSLKLPMIQHIIRVRK